MLELEELAEKTIKIADKLGCKYCDVRAENLSMQGISINNGEIQYKSSSDNGIGIRILKNGAWAFAAISNPKEDKVTNAIYSSVKNAEHASKSKRIKISLAENSTVKKTIHYKIDKKPNLGKIIEIGYQCDSAIKGVNKIKKSLVNILCNKTNKIFLNSQGSKIIQNYTDVIGEATAIAHESGITQSINTTEGGRGGLEQITDKNNLVLKSKEIALKASKLVDAKPAKEDKTSVIFNPDFVSLLTHEILGHPSEADRVLGKEMAWAGGAWWAGKIDQSIGSEHLNVFDDPTINQSLGWYEYDDEGVKSSKTNLVENGILKNHFQSRETAVEFGTKPTANMRAASYRHMPLIRMACTCIDKGDFTPEEMIKDVKSGYLISDMKVPSIDMYRYNWNISCQYANKIENGIVTDLVRDVIVTGTAPEFFKSIDACGCDFTVRPITNCGKGDPMQPMMMGNGGPSIRGIATVKSVEI